jgi:hypothetical protein
MATVRSAKSLRSSLTIGCFALQDRVFAERAELRLITCGGTFDPQLRSYLGNTVVYAVQVSGGPE